MKVRACQDGRILRVIELEQTPWRDEAIAVAAECLGMDGDAMLQEIVETKQPICITLEYPDGARHKVTIHAKLTGECELEMVSTELPVLRP
jgi:hypothetical protein